MLRKIKRFLVGCGPLYYSICPVCGTEEYQCGVQGLLSTQKKHFYTYPCEKCED